jgi:predicted PurR-regulated permease PerM
MPRWTRLLALVVLVGAALYFWGNSLTEVRHALTPVFAAFMIAYLLDPLVDRFEARRVPRVVAIFIVLGLFLVGCTLVVLLVVPAVVGEVVSFATRELPPLLDRAQSWVEGTLHAYGYELPHDWSEAWALARTNLGGQSSGDMAGRATTILTEIGKWAWGGTRSIFGLVGSLLVVPVLAFYLLYDFDRIVESIRELLPWRYRPFVVDVAGEVDQMLGQFVRGQFLVMIALAVLYSIAYAALGVRLAIPIGIVAGILSFIPYVGGASALVLALLMCLLHWRSWWQIGGVVIAYAIIQVLEGFVITPRIVGDKVGLSSVWVLVALLVGGELFGFLGVLLAVPVAAVIKIFAIRAIAHYRKTHFFSEGAPPTEGALAKVLEEEGLADDPALALAKQEALSHAEQRASKLPPAESIDEAVAALTQEQALDPEVASEPAQAEPPIEPPPAPSAEADEEDPEKKDES